ncbi:uncharacterized protein TEOVI_000110300 [Trypanosoma equiperdum]|uniref:Uncharacterized protein n=2 Tax=Trypanozoon TaxID=39700 RepID=Q383E8_TRYB2|nr:hypothetical protein, conserved [Trypanosoma brucei brucei TREU927]EAN80083.1 hypothetical protein, conserved [Trypanosoma brucei brucei TREU927]SCU69537.1 hypothetical protein, conserved [Trypanosoma equiperdum]
MVWKGSRERGVQEYRKKSKGNKPTKGEKVSKKGVSSSRQPKQRELLSAKQQQQQNRKNEELRAALAGAFSTEVSSSNAGPAFDGYGKGSPTDRLQFGYAPAVAAEAVAYHSTISTDAWIEARRTRYRTAIVEQKKLRRPNCEPITSILKLQGHWRSTELFEREVHGSHAVAQDKVDDILDTFVSRQRVA